MEQLIHYMGYALSMPYIGYAFILLICIEIALVAFGRIKPRAYPYMLYLTGVGMVLMTTLAGPHLIGSDVHIEYYWAQWFSGEDVWMPLRYAPQATSLANSLIPSITPFPIIWLYKVVYPVIFASVPVILYFVYRCWLTSTQACFASFLFIAFPTFFMELPTIGRQMLAEVALAFTLLVVFKLQLRWQHRTLMLVALGALVPLFHYGTGLVAIVFVGTGLLVSIILKKWVLSKSLSTVLIAIFLVGVLYFPFVAGGVVTYKLKYLYNQFVPEVVELEFKVPETNPNVPVYTLHETEKGEVGEVEEVKPKPLLPVVRTKPFYEYYGDLVRSSLGFDFAETTPMGKLFRVLQWIIGALVAIGFWKMGVRRGYFVFAKRGYFVFASGGIVLMLLCLIPGFAATLNLTRFAHLALFLLAPVFAVALRPRYLLIVIVPYFLLTSGFVFEVTQQPDVEEIVIPYSVALSNDRMDLGASCTEDDLAVRDYIVDNELFPIYADKTGGMLVDEQTGIRMDINRALFRHHLDPQGYYIFLRSRNIIEGMFVVYHDIGCRRHIELGRLGVGINENVIYQSGEARVLYVPAIQDEFTIVVLPDTQDYVARSEYNHYFYEQTQWIADNRDDFNIVAVFHVGDIVQRGWIKAEWVFADKAMGILDNVVPYTVLPGNHDYSNKDICDRSARDLTLYEQYFGVDRFSEYDWYGGNYPGKSNRNNYMLFEGGGIKWLGISLQWGPEDDELDWAEGIINSYPDRLVIISTHAYMYGDDTRACDAKGTPQGPSTTNLLTGNDGEEIWDELVRFHDNIVLVVSGHYVRGYDEHGCNGRRVDYVNGEPIHQAMSNYQAGLKEGGNGYLRYYTFKPSENIIEAYSFSPRRDNYFTGSESQFTWSFRSENPRNNYQAFVDSLPFTRRAGPFLEPSGTPGSYDKDGLENNFVIDDPSNPDQLLMYYNPGTLEGHIEYAAVATSIKGSDVWTKWSGNPLFDIDASIRSCSPIYHDGMFYLYYNGDGTGGANLATSTDGFNFTKYANNPVATDPGCTGGEPYVFKEGDTWYMYYGISKPTRMIRVQTSIDGIHWSNATTVLYRTGDANRGFFAESKVVYNIGGTYVMLYDAFSEHYPPVIHMATSSSPVGVFTNWPDNPVFTGSGVAEEWDEVAVSTPALYWDEDSGRWDLYYVGTDTWPGFRPCGYGVANTLSKGKDVHKVIE